MQGTKGLKVRQKESTMEEITDKERKLKAEVRHEMEYWEWLLDIGYVKDCIDTIKNHAVKWENRIQIGSEV